MFQCNDRYLELENADNSKSIEYMMRVENIIRDKKRDEEIVGLHHSFQNDLTCATFHSDLPLYQWVQ